MQSSSSIAAAPRVAVPPAPVLSNETVATDAGGGEVFATNRNPSYRPADQVGS
jgi:hypothetical protein